MFRGIPIIEFNGITGNNFGSVMKTLQSPSAFAFLQRAIRIGRITPTGDATFTLKL